MTYGVDQCVGDTLPAGDIMYGQRNIPFILDLSKDIRDLAKPDCLFLNHANPTGMNVWAAHHFGGVRVVGPRHGVQHGHQQIAKVHRCEYGDLHVACAGINHQTWYTKLVHTAKTTRADLWRRPNRLPWRKERRCAWTCCVGSATTRPVAICALPGVRKLPR